MDKSSYSPVRAVTRVPSNEGLMDWMLRKESAVHCHHDLKSRNESTNGRNCTDAAVWQQTLTILSVISENFFCKEHRYVILYINK